MAVTSCELLFTGRGGTDDFKRHRTYTRVYEVLTDDVADAEQAVGAAAGIPPLGAPFDEDSDAVVVSYDAQQSDDSPYIWYVTIEYDTEPPQPEAVDIDGEPFGTADMPENPLLVPPTWKITTQDSEEPAIEARKVNEAGAIVVPLPNAWAVNTAYQRGTYVSNGGNVYVCASTTGDRKSAAAGGGPAGNGTGIADNNVTWDFYATLADTQNDPNKPIFAAVHNSANLPFDPPATVEVSRAVLSVSKNMPFASLAYLLALKNAVNIVPWRGIPARCAKVLKIEHDGGKRQNGVTYVTTQWEIGLDPDTWDLRVLDAGFHELVTYTRQDTGEQVTEYQRIMDASNQPITDPVPLNGSGKRLRPDDAPVFLRFVPRQCRLIDFNGVLPF